MVPGESWFARCFIRPMVPNMTTGMAVVPSVTVASIMAGGRALRVRRTEERTTWTWTVACSPSVRVRRSVSSPQVS